MSNAGAHDPNRYELWDRVGGDRIIAHRGRDSQTGQAILLHQFRPGVDHADIHRLIIRYLLREGAKPVPVMDMIRLEGQDYLVTADEPICLALREWLEWEMSQGRPAEPVQAPAEPEPSTFTSMFGAPQLSGSTAQFAAPAAIPAVTPAPALLVEQELPPPIAVTPQVEQPPDELKTKPVAEHNPEFPFELKESPAKQPQPEQPEPKPEFKREESEFTRAFRTSGSGVFPRPAAIASGEFTQAGFAPSEFTQAGFTTAGSKAGSKEDEFHKTTGGFNQSQITSLQWLASSAPPAASAALPETSRRETMPKESLPWAHTPEISSASSSWGTAPAPKPPGEPAKPQSEFSAIFARPEQLYTPHPVETRPETSRASGDKFPLGDSEQAFSFGPLSGGEPTLGGIPFAGNTAPRKVDPPPFFDLPDGKLTENADPRMASFPSASPGQSSAQNSKGLPSAAPEPHTSGPSEYTMIIRGGAKPGAAGPAASSSDSSGASATGGGSGPAIRIQPPQVNLPVTPTLSAPHIQTPHIQAPHLQVPNVQAPHVQMPHVQVPHMTAPNLNIASPSMSLPNASLPSVGKAASPVNSKLMLLVFAVVLLIALALIAMVVIRRMG